MSSYTLTKIALSNIIVKKYIKKVIVTDEQASAEARGERLRKIRNLANLTRKDLCNSEDLKLNTYKGWELARFGGLPIDGAERVIARVAQEHVICTAQWLLYGKGQEPYIVPQISLSSNPNEQELILKELYLFQSLYAHAAYTAIADDALSPDYRCGDYVAGIKLYDQHIAAALNQVCIVELDDGRILVRYVQAADEKEHYQLVASNNHDNRNDPPPLIAKLHFAAPVIRHYKINPLLDAVFHESVTGIIK